MRDFDVRLEIGEGTVYADTVEDLAIVVDQIRAEKQGEIAALQADNARKRDAIVKLEADLKDYKETAVYGPQLHAERQAALESRDRALEQLEALRQSHADGDKTRRALAADVRDLKARLELEMAVNKEMNEELARLQRLLAKKKRRAKR